MIQVKYGDDRPILDSECVFLRAQKDSVDHLRAKFNIPVQVADISWAGDNAQKVWGLL